ncbi:hypothetical protein RYX36_003838 [Vicia faba]
MVQVTPLFIQNLFIRNNRSVTQICKLNAFIKAKWLIHSLYEYHQVDPIVVSFSGGEVGMVSVLMLIKANIVEQQEKIRCKYSLKIDRGFQKFLDRVEYSEKSILRYEGIYGRGFISARGLAVRGHVSLGVAGAAAVYALNALAPQVSALKAFLKVAATCNDLHELQASTVDARDETGGHVSQVDFEAISQGCRKLESILFFCQTMTNTTG